MSKAEKKPVVQLLPYVKIKGEYTLSDNVVMGFFNQLIEDRTNNTVFSDGFIKDGFAFLAYMKEDRNLPAFAFIDERIVGVAWLNGITGRHAFAHFSLLKESWGKYSDEIGREYLQYWFMLPGVKGGPMFDVLLGMIPSSNTAANKYIERLGFDQVGEIPNMTYNAKSDSYQPVTLSYIIR